MIEINYFELPETKSSYNKKTRSCFILSSPEIITDDIAKLLYNLLVQLSFTA